MREERKKCLWRCVCHAGLKGAAAIPVSNVGSGPKGLPAQTGCHNGVDGGRCSAPNPGDEPIQAPALSLRNVFPLSPVIANPLLPTRWGTLGRVGASRREKQIPQTQSTPMLR